MKLKKSLLLACVLIFFSCSENINSKKLDASTNLENKSQETNKPEPIKSSFIPDTEPNSKPTPFLEYPPEKINILPKIELKMEYPYDIEVSKDGKTIYFKNWYNYPKANDNYLDERIPEQYEKELKRRVIFKLDLETKKIEVFKIGYDPLIYNELGQEMEIDGQNNLYVNVMNHYVNNLRYRNQESKSLIYKISDKGDILNSYNVLELKNKPHKVGGIIEELYYQFEGPFKLFIRDENIFYSMFKPDRESPSQRLNIIKKLNLESKENIEIVKETVDDNYSFIIDDNLLFTFLGFFQANIFDLKLKKNISDTDTKWESIDFKNIDRSKNNKFIKGYYSINNSIKKNTKNEIFSIGVDSVFKHKLADKSIRIIGNYPYGLKDGKSNEASFDYPSSLSIDKNDNVYVADTGNNAIRKITPEGEVSTFYEEKK